MRELTDEELKSVSGGLNIPTALGGIALAWEIGLSTGEAINTFNASQGRSLGNAIYQFTH